MFSQLLSPKSLLEQIENIYRKNLNPYQPECNAHDDQFLQIRLNVNDLPPNEVDRLVDIFKSSFEELKKEKMIDPISKIDIVTGVYLIDLRISFSIMNEQFFEQESKKQLSLFKPSKIAPTEEPKKEVKRSQVDPVDPVEDKISQKIEELKRIFYKQLSLPPVELKDTLKKNPQPTSIYPPEYNIVKENLEIMIVYSTDKEKNLVLTAIDELKKLLIANSIHLKITDFYIKVTIPFSSLGVFASDFPLKPGESDYQGAPGGPSFK